MYAMPYTAPACDLGLHAATALYLIQKMMQFTSILFGNQPSIKIMFSAAVMTTMATTTTTKKGKKVTVGARVKPRARDKQARYGEGIVIESVAVQMWKVRFNNGQEEIFSSKSLSVVDNCEPDPRVAPTPMPPAILQSETEAITMFVIAEDSENLQSPWPFLELTEHDDSDVALVLVAEEGDMRTAPTPAPAAHPTTVSTLCNNSSTTGSRAPQLELSLSSDIDEETGDDDVDEDVNDARRRERKEKADREKAELIAEPFTVTKLSKAGGITYEYTWKAVEQSAPAVQVTEYSNKLGLRGYNFSLFEQRPGDDHISEVFLLLWPGIATEQLETMNRAIDTENRKSPRNRPTRLVSEAEWWKFIAIIVASGALQKGGAPMFEKKSSGITQAPNIGEKVGLALTRFNQIRWFFVEALKDPLGKEDEDSWSKIQHFLEDFNANRTRTVAASIYKTFDESMSAFRPQTSKTGNLPHLSSIPRKPESLGTELKCTSCAKTKIMLHLEIQKGKQTMARSTFQSELGATSACTLRMALTSRGCGWPEGDHKSDIFIGDSWFGSVNSAEQLWLQGLNFIGKVKNAHKFCPMKVRFSVKTLDRFCSLLKISVGCYVIFSYFNRRSKAKCVTGQLGHLSS